MRPARVSWPGFVALVLGFLVLYGTFRSQDLTAVDGAVRSLDVYHRGEVVLHGNNHLLYPANVWAWDRLTRRWLGPSPDGLAFVRRTQLMNSAAMALVAGLLFLLVGHATGSVGAALGAAAAYGLSRAVLLHATNSAEPPVGVALSILAIAAAAAARGPDGTRAWLAGVSGLLFAAAMATYQ